MKKKLHLTVLLLLIGTFSANLRAQCSLNITATDTITCIGDSVTLTANTLGPGYNLPSTFAAGNNHRGNMFDLSATNTLTITSFDAHPMANTTIEIYYRPTPYAGFETSSAGWIFIGSAAVVAQPMGSPTPVPVPVNVVIPAGQTYSFYVTSNNTAISLNYTDGAAEGAPYTSDANLTFRQGVGMEYPFTNGSGSVFRPRVWNGVVHYALPTTTTYLWSTGSTNSSITVAPTSTTLYTLDVNITGCGALNGSKNITVGNPIVDLGADQSECVDGSIMLDAGNSFSSYNWSTTETTQTISLDGDTVGAGTNTYSVTVTDAFGCTDSDTVDVTFNALPTVNLGTDQNVCFNDSLLLDAGSGFTSYTWSTSAITQTQMVNSSFGLGTTEFSVTVVDSNTCSNADTIQLTLVAPPTIDLGADDTICVSGSVLLDAGAGTFTYLWNDGSTTQTVNPTGTNLGVGVHPIYVIVTDANLCNGTDTVNINVLSCLGVEDNNLHIQLNMYPNPATDLINLNIDSQTEGEMTISILNDLGQTILVQNMDCMEGNQNKLIDISHLSSGIYLVQIALNGETLTKKIIIQ